MTRSGRVDYEAVSRAQARLLDTRRLSNAELVAAYQMVRTATPDAYTEKLVAALISQSYDLSDPPARVAVRAEAVQVARTAAETDPRHAKLLADALGAHQHALYDAGRRADGLEACRAQAHPDQAAHRPVPRHQPPASTPGPHEHRSRPVTDDLYT